jgi:hypothetical protein
MSKKTYTASDITAVMDKGMTDFQIKNFVVGAQLTPLKQLHQAAIEIEAREGNLRQSDFEEKKQNLKIKILNEKLKRTTDDLERAELELEILVVENKLEAILRERTRMDYELKSFYEVVDYFNENYDIEEMLSMKDTLDIDYWVKRLSKQASLDLVSTGRISNGNLSAMMDMPEEIFEICLKETYKLATTLSKSVPMPALTAPDEEFLIKFGPNTGVEHNAIAQETDK